MSRDTTSQATASSAVAFPDNIISTEPFDGLVNVRYRGAVIASSTKAVEATCSDGRVIHLLPFRDVNFELLEEHDQSATGARALGYWDAVVKGDRLPMAVGVIERPPEGHQPLIAHAVFLSDALDVDIMTSAQTQEYAAEWPR